METWYVLEDGRTVDPNEVAPNEAEVLFHSSGVAVAMRGQVPHTRGVYPDDERAKAAPEVTAKPKKYKTREAKAE